MYFVRDILKNIFNIPSTIKIENNTLRLYFNHNELAIWLKKEFGNVYSKFIHYK